MWEMGGGSKQEVLLNSTLSHLETKLVAVKVGPATATASSSPGSHQKEVKNSLGTKLTLKLMLGYY